MIKVWIVSFLLLLGLVEFYQWVKHFRLPLPVIILGGALLAIAANSPKSLSFPLQRQVNTTQNHDRKST